MTDSEEIAYRIVRAEVGCYLVDVRLRGPEETWVFGYVLGHGSKWVLLAETRAGGFLDGFVAVRLRDIIGLRRRRTFDAGTLERHGLPAPSYGAPLPNLDRTRALMEDLASRYLLIGMWRDVVRPGRYDLGFFAGADRGRLWHLPLAATARWKRKLLGIRPGEITRIDVDDSYLNELALAAGPAPQPTRTHQWDEPSDTR